MSFAPPPGPPPENALTYAPPPGPPPPDGANDQIVYAPPAGPPPADIPSLYDIERKARISHLGPFAVLHDMLLHGLLTRLDAKSLTTLSTVNKAFYIYARDDTVWRSLCVRTYTIPKSASPEERKSKIDAMGMDPAEPMLSFKGTWRLTYYFPKKKLSDAEAQQLEKARSIKASTITPPFFSDFLYQKTLRNTMDLSTCVPDFASGLCIPVPVVKEDKKIPDAAQEFRRKFDSTSTPVLIKGGFEFDKEKWRMEALKEKFGKHRFSVGTEQPDYLHRGVASGPLLMDMAFEDYVEYMKTQRDECPLYIFDGSYGEKAPELLDYYKIPRFFEEDFLSVLGNDRRPPFRWIVAGPARSGATWHIDPFFTSAWNALVSGRKRWCLYPPTMVPPGIIPDRGSRSGFDAPSALHWFTEVYPMIPVEYRPLEIIQEPGDVIFVPAGWWHAVLNLDEVNVAVTQNFVSEANLEKVLAGLLIEKQEQNFAELRSLLTASKPELKSAFQHIHQLFGDSGDPLIAAEGCSSRAQFFESFLDLELWLPRIVEVWKREFAGETVPNIDEVFPIKGGSNPVFLHPASGRILKFYAHMDGGQTTHAVESYVLQAMTSSPDAELRNSVPRLLHSGRLLGGDDLSSVDAKGVCVADDANKGRWSWPYIIMTRLGGDAHIPIGGWEWKVRATAADEEEGAEKEYRKRNREKKEGAERKTEMEGDEWTHTVKWIGEALKRLHATRPVAGTVVKGTNAKDRRVYGSFVKRRLETCVARHKDLGSLPVTLLTEMEGRLKDFEEMVLGATEKLEGMELAAGLLHGDMNPGNVLGSIPEVTDGTPSVFQPEFLIDFGDAFAFEEADGKLLDALWDLGGTCVGVLKCQPEMVELLMQTYTGGLWRKVDRETRMRIRRRMMVLTLVCGHQGYIRFAVRAAGGTKRLEAKGVTWEGLVEELFGKD